MSCCEFEFLNACSRGNFHRQAQWAVLSGSLRSALVLHGCWNASVRVYGALGSDCVMGGGAVCQNLAAGTFPCHLYARLLCCRVAFSEFGRACVSEVTSTVLFITRR